MERNGGGWLIETVLSTLEKSWFGYSVLDDRINWQIGATLGPIYKTYGRLLAS